MRFAEVVRVTRIVLAGVALIAGGGARADDVVLRVVDVGAGLCVVGAVPGGHAMVYDTGFGAARCLAAVAELVPNHQIDLLVLSHSDADHIGATEKILAGNSVKTIIHPGDKRTGDTLDAARVAIRGEPGADIWDLAERAPALGQRFAVGDATATFIAGWSDGHDTEGPDPELTDEAMLRNALSVVIRFEYHGHSVLLTGDTVGRYADSNDGLCQYAEQRMVERVASIPINSDVLIGQHHGADNATSNCFIRAVSPEWVIFSASHKTGIRANRPPTA